MNVVGRACQNYVILFGTLEQSIEQRLVGSNLLLNDSVINGRLILQQRIGALFIKRLLQSLFLLLGATKLSFEIGLHH